MNCPSCGEPTEAGAKFCRSCGAALTQQPQQAKPKNKIDEHVKEIARSKTLKVYLTFIFVFLCLIPSMCICVSLMGFGSFASYFNSIFQ